MLKWFLICIVLLVVLAELVARFGLGLGDPPLSMFDPDMEYRFQPNKTYHRFGRLVHYNAYSQRADDFPKHKSSPQELRVMVIGDSVVNGGSETDQSEVITSILQKRLRETLHRNVVVGNISAGSWGPPNELAYVKDFGLFDADVVVLVFNDSDAGDAMTFAPIVGIAPSFPDHKPMFALQEVWARYLPMYLARFQSPPPAPAPASAQAADDERDYAICMDAIRQLVAIARQRGAKVIIGQQREVPERVNPIDRPKLIRGHQLIATTARELGIEPVEWNDAFHAALQSGRDPYRPGDFVHPSVVGNQIIADTLFPLIRDALTQSATHPTTNPS